MLYLPLTATPVGWVILGLGGYALYKAGKKKGEDKIAASQIKPVPEAETPAKTSADKTKGGK